MIPVDCAGPRRDTIGLDVRADGAGWCFTFAECFAAAVVGDADDRPRAAGGAGWDGGGVGAPVVSVCAAHVVVAVAGDGPIRVHARCGGG
ncbi:hypothetical protein RSPPQCQH_CDS0048 [Mycolicibacterium phage phi1_186001]